MSAHKLKIKLFGEAWKLKMINFDDNLLYACEETAKKMNQPITSALIDPFFYHYLKIKSIQSHEDFEGETIEGLINSPKNQIEIWYKNKKLKKIIINDLLDEFLLFPLYNSTLEKFNAKIEAGIYVEQKEIGLIGTFETTTENFNIENLDFRILEMNELTILNEIFYNSNPLKNVKKDTVITFQNCNQID